MRITTTKRGDRIAFITLEDGTGKVEIAIFSDVLAEHRELVVKDQLVLVQGELSQDPYSDGFRMSCQRMMTIAQARKDYGKYLLLHIKAKDVKNDVLSTLTPLIKPFCVSSATPLHFAYHSDLALAHLRCGENWQVTVTDDFLEQLQQTLGEENIEMVY